MGPYVLCKEKEFGISANSFIEKVIFSSLYLLLFDALYFFMIYTNCGPHSDKVPIDIFAGYRGWYILSDVAPFVFIYFIYIFSEFFILNNIIDIILFDDDRSHL